MASECSSCHPRSGHSTTLTLMILIIGRSRSGCWMRWRSSESSDAKKRSLHSMQNNTGFMRKVLMASRWRASDSGSVFSFCPFSSSSLCAKCFWTKDGRRITGGRETSAFLTWQITWTMRSLWCRLNSRRKVSNRKFWESEPRLFGSRRWSWAEMRLQSKKRTTRRKAKYRI